jgi:hypothetical protein
LAEPGFIMEIPVNLRRLEVERNAQSASQQMRLARFRDACYEATWIELEFQT